MARTLQDILAEFVERSPETIGMNVIHMSSATTREPIISRLQEAVGPLEQFEAIRDVKDHPTKCATEPGKIRTAGEIGCLLSHISAMRQALAEQKTHLCIFEDDCALGSKFSLGSVEIYLRDVKEIAKKYSLEGTNDFLLFGSCGCYNARPITNLAKATNQFNGTHCYLIGRAMMEKVIGSYEHLLKNKVVFPIDGLLGLVLRAQHRWTLCPEDEKGFFVQNREIPSYVLHDGNEPRRE
jgi:GR25 family glycosyltransferase involved in LPS biosynthesis